MDCPCKQCEDRVIGCHAVCAGYKQWKRITEETKAQIEAKRAPYEQSMAYYTERSAKQAKRKHSKGER